MMFLLAPKQGDPHCDLGSTVINRHMGDGHIHGIRVPEAHDAKCQVKYTSHVSDSFFIIPHVSLRRISRVIDETRCVSRVCKIA